MDKSPHSRKKAADIPQQELGNEPQNGKRPGQRDAMTNDHYDPQGKLDADKRVLTAPDTLEAKHKSPILAQPPKRLRVGTSSQCGLYQQHAYLKIVVVPILPVAEAFMKGDGSTQVLAITN